MKILSLWSRLASCKYFALSVAVLPKALLALAAVAVSSPDLLEKEILVLKRPRLETSQVPPHSSLQAIHIPGIGRGAAQHANHFLVTTPSHLPTAFWHQQIQNSSYPCPWIQQLVAIVLQQEKESECSCRVSSSSIESFFSSFLISSNWPSKLNSAIRHFNEAVSTKKFTLTEAQRARFKLRTHFKAELDFGLTNTRDRKPAKKGKRGTVTNCSR